jgi:hypothetical protein
VAITDVASPKYATPHLLLHQSIALMALYVKIIFDTNTHGHSREIPLAADYRTLA